MNILISGATGYIGSSLINALINDNFNIGVINRTKADFFKQFENKIDMYNADIIKEIKITLKKKYSLFIHLAAANDIDSFNPEVALKATTLGTRNSLELCKKNNIKKFIYFSTFQVYGVLDGEMNEHTVKNSVNDYGITHKFAEDYVKMYHNTVGINYIILIPTNIYGSPINKHIDRWTLVPNCFCKQAFEEKKIILKSSGKQVRDFISLSDIVNVTKSLCIYFDDFKDQTMNVSSGNNFSILEIAQLVKKQYELIFHKKCDLIIKSDLPKKPNKFSINRDLISTLNHKFDNRNAVIEEINNIFNLLSSK